jgi:AdoMet-dependent heme synthase
MTAGERLVVLWRIEERCNLGCGFCGFSSELTRSRRATDADEIRRVIDLLAELRQPVLLSWLGGEPFLRRDLPELTRYAVSAGLSVSTTSNGTLLGSADLRRHVLDCYAELTLSVDGLPALHDRVRGLSGGFARVKAAARALVSERRELGRGPLLRVNSVLMRDNVRSFPELARELADWGIDEITLNQLGGAERPEFHAAHSLTPADVDHLFEALPSLRRELASSGVRLLGGAAYLLRLRASARAIELPVSDCRPGETFLFIDEAGRVSPCNAASGERGLPLAALTRPRDFQRLPEQFRALTARACGDCLSTRTFAKFDAA